MSRALQSRLRALELATPGCDIFVVFNALSGPDDPALMPHFGETFDQYRNRIVADGMTRKMTIIMVLAWYGADSRPYDGNWHGDHSESDREVDCGDL